jgi:capsular polysaccharide biosynthesis protein
MSVKPGWTRKRHHKILLGVFVLLGLLAGAGYAVLKPPVLTSTALVALPPNVHNMATQAAIADSTPVLEGALRRIHPAVSLPALRHRIQAKSVTSNILSVAAQGKTAAEAEGAANAVVTSYIASVGTTKSPAGAGPAHLLQPATSTTGPSLVGHLLLMGWIGALVGLLIGAIVALAVSLGAPAAPAPAT